MSEAISNFESLLREALTPVEPPEGLVERLELTLTSITEMAADELEAWELSAMRDPRNWVRPVAALVVGGAAGSSAMTTAQARSPVSSSGSPITATSATPGCSIRASSTSRAEMFSILRMMTSLIRPVTVSVPFASTKPRSPVLR